MLFPFVPQILTKRSPVANIYVHRHAERKYTKSQELSYPGEEDRQHWERVSSGQQTTLLLSSWNDTLTPKLSGSSVGQGRKGSCSLTEFPQESRNTHPNKRNAATGGVGTINVCLRVTADIASESRCLSLVPRKDYPESISFLKFLSGQQEAPIKVT